MMRFLQRFFGVMLWGGLVSIFIACSDHSFVTNPDEREDIASWYKPSSVPISSSSEMPSNSSSSSEKEVSSSSHTDGSLSSEKEASSSSNTDDSSSSGYGPEGSIFHEGQSYKTMVIGNQVWFAQNVNRGSFISSGTQTNDELIETNCYDNNQSLCDTYGGLYTWAESMGLSAVNNESTTEYLHLDDKLALGVCPNDWHVSTLADWDTLISFLGAEVAAKFVKDSSADYSVWNIHDYNLKEKNGLLVLPAGFMDTEGASKEMGVTARFWTTYESTATMARSIAITAESVTIANHVDLDKKSMLSIRCVKNKNQ